MSKYLVALIWPAGMAVMLCAAFLTSRRAELAPVSAGGAQAGHGGRRHSRRAAGSAVSEAARLVAVAAAGAVVAIGVMSLLGLVVVNHGLTVDKPVFHWITTHQVHAMAAAMKRLTKIGDTWTTWGAAAAAAACIAVASRDRRWLAPVALTSLIVADHFTTLALRHVFHRVGPPTSPLGTYPSGGCDRCIVFYGLIAYLLWREFSGRRTTAIWAAAAVAALGFNEAFSRVYLSKHWLTDALSGLIYGALLLAGYILAVRAGARAAPARSMSAAESQKQTADPQGLRQPAGPEGLRQTAGPEGLRQPAGPEGLVT
jgi:membrane-associated phospholipid phosphatase